MQDRFIQRARLGPRLAWPLWLLLVILMALAVGIRWGHAALVVLPPLAVFTLACETSWFLVKALPLRTAKVAGILASHAAAAAVLSAMWIAGLVAWGRFISEPAGLAALPAQFERQLPLLFAVGVFYYLLVAAYYYLILALEASREASRREAEARLLARESELKALRAQINPHFLFNSLHSISALTSIDPPGARTMCIQLADYLRSTLGSGEKTRISLADELRLVKQYLAVERVRFGSRMVVEEAIEPASLTSPLPPLILQPLVENAIKHGVAAMTGTAHIRLEARLDNNWLTMAISNDYDPEGATGKGTGLGLSNVRERLRAGYGDPARLTSGGNDGMWRVELRVPMEGG